LLHGFAYQSMQCVEDTDLSCTTMHPTGIHRGVLLRKTVKKSCVGIALGRAPCHYHHCRRRCRLVGGCVVEARRTQGTRQLEVRKRW
jgi:hypothetical protein